MTEQLETMAKSQWKGVRNHLYSAASITGGLGVYFGYDLSQILQGNSTHDSYIVGSALMGCAATSYVSGQLGVIAGALHKRSANRVKAQYTPQTDSE